MALQQILDVTADFNDGSVCTLDIGGWEFAVVQLVTPTGTVNFLTSNDAGANDAGDGSAISATNFIAVTGTNLATATGATSLSASGLIKFTGIGQFLRLSGAAVTVTKAIVRLYKTF